VNEIDRKLAEPHGLLALKVAIPVPIGVGVEETNGLGDGVGLVEGGHISSVSAIIQRGVESRQAGRGRQVDLGIWEGVLEEQIRTGSQGALIHSTF